jgi:predicted secreted protein
LKEAAGLILIGIKNSKEVDVFDETEENKSLNFIVIRLL